MYGAVVCPYCEKLTHDDPPATVRPCPSAGGNNGSNLRSPDALGVRPVPEVPPDLPGLRGGVLGKNEALNPCGRFCFFFRPTSSTNPADVELHFFSKKEA